MNIHVLDTSFQLPSPDMNIVIGSRTNLKRTVDALSEVYLPVMQEILRSLMYELDNVDKTVLDALTLIPHQFNNDELLTLVAAIEKIRSQPAASNNEAAMLGYSEEVRTLLKERIEGLADKSKELDKALINLEAVQVNNLDHLTPGMSQQVQTLEARLASEQERLDQELEKEAELGKSIVLIENSTIFDRFKPLVSSLEKVVDINPKDPLIGSIRAAIAGVSNILEVFGDAIKYDDLISAREKLQARIDEIRTSVEVARAALKDETRKRDQLMGFATVREHKTAYVEEIGKLRDALKHVVGASVLPGTELIEEQVRHFTRQADALTRYLVDLRASWRS